MEIRDKELLNNNGQRYERIVPVYKAGGSYEYYSRQVDAHHITSTEHIDPPTERPTTRETTNDQAMNVTRSREVETTVKLQLEYTIHCVLRDQVRSAPMNNSLRSATLHQSSNDQPRCTRTNMYRVDAILLVV